MTAFGSLPGAVLVPEFGVPAHYGEPLAEQRALDAGAAIVDLSHRGVVIVEGEDRLSWLHSMTSQRLTGLRPGESTETLLLDPNGRIERAIRLVDDGERAWLLVDEGSAEPLAAYLTRMRFALRVAVRDASDEYAAVLAFAGPAAELLRGSDPVAEWRDPWAGVLPGGIQYQRGAEHAGAEWSASQFVFPRPALAGLAERIRLGEVRAAGTLALDALEVRAWRPTQHADVDDRSIPHEFDWLRTSVHLTKGCYRGQETVAKVHNLGHPPRRLALLHLDGSGGSLPVPGALVHLAGGAQDPAARPVGRVTRSALHHEWGAIALVLLKRSVPEDAELEVRGGETGDDPHAEVTEVLAATQEVIVPADAGAARDVPRLKRL
ncbi:Folate-dependent protein for Fe/S cluster synthesis/repair in oxidative stress [Leucobacter sp. 7(1)]|uniref:CAF17-like 4Fe-4S cluster assembly/insertion protein YgfZ n=1 Tax=Leucobacter sp. 7(1) TaxID=1255613 RepID=UPI00097EDF02|nr:folate-binding protein YgfZ [Leucobacter sp. 7(1)]SJN13014.1 Folate-dependent protein for Fe/S cluster synthesis/repair in oxidative stress [Leucobacter sp. 7(1)]